MQKYKRRIIFYGLIFVFVLITPLILIYSFGYSFDAKTRTLVSTGGIFLKTNQTAITIDISNGQQKVTSFLAFGALIPDLPEGSYHVKITKAGFRPWEKDIEVKKQTVSEYRGIFLIPEKVFSTERLFNKQKPFTFIPSPDGRYIAFLSEKTSVIAIQETKTSILEFSKTVLRSAFPKNLHWADSNTLVWDSSGGEGTQWSTVQINDSGILQSQISIPDGAGGSKPIVIVNPHPSVAGSYYALTADRTLYLWDPKAPRKPTQILTAVLSFFVSSGKIFFINEKGFFASADTLGENVLTIGRPGFFLNGPFTSETSPNGFLAIIDNLSGLFLYDDTSQTIVPIQGGIRDVAFDEKGDKMVLWGEHSVSVVFLNDETNPPFRKKFAKEKIVETKKPIANAAWYADNYIVYTSDDGLFGAELAEDSNHILQTFSTETGDITTDNSSVSVINDKGIYRFVIE